MTCCSKTVVALALVACLVVVGVSGADILNPKMTPEKGTFEAPFGKLGEKGTGPWSQTTVAAGVDGKPLKGEVKTVTGEIVDYSCYLQLGKHGAKHRDCGQKCLKNGQPIGLLTKEGKLFLLMEEEHDPAPRRRHDLPPGRHRCHGLRHGSHWHRIRRGRPARFVRARLPEEMTIACRKNSEMRTTKARKKEITKSVVLWFFRAFGDSYWSDLGGLSMRCRLMMRTLLIVAALGAAWKMLDAGTSAGPAKAVKAVELFPAGGPKIPLGLVEIEWPKDNGYTPAKAELGWLLFFDNRLSSDATVSCASCHAPAHAFSDGQPVSLGIGGQKGKRSAPTVINRVYGRLQFWDGRAASLEDQAKGPLANPLEMTSEKEADKAHGAVVGRLRKIDEYRKRFKDVFGTDEITVDHVAKAVATFERMVLSGNSPYDRFKAGDKTALTPSQQRGMDVFFSNNARCDACHDGSPFTTNQFANIGIGMDKPNPDLGRYLVTKKDEDKGAFKTPGLRDVAHTGPYMHDGSLKTLEDVVEHYDKGGIKNQWLHQDIRPLKLSKQDKTDLVAFLHALNGEGWQQFKAPTRFPK